MTAERHSCTSSATRVRATEVSACAEVNSGLNAFRALRGSQVAHQANYSVGPCVLRMITLPVRLLGQQQVQQGRELRLLPHQARGPPQEHPAVQVDPPADPRGAGGRGGLIRRGARLKKPGALRQRVPRVSLRSSRGAAAPRGRRRISLGSFSPHPPRFRAEGAALALPEASAAPCTASLACAGQVLRDEAAR